MLASETPPVQRVLVHRDRPRVSTNYPGWAAGLGVAVVAGGVGMFALAWQSAHGGPPRPVAVLAILGFWLVLAGLLLAGFTLAGVRLRQRASEAGRRRPWDYDHRWDSKGTHDGSGKRVARNAMAIAGIALFVAPFHLLDWSSFGGQWVAYAFLGVFDLALLAGVGFNAVLLLRWQKFGKTRVLFRQFPYFTGRPVRVTFAGGPALCSRTGFKAELHCIQEYFERHGRGNDSMATPVMESVWRTSQPFATNGDGLAELTFDTPADAPGTDLIPDSKPRLPHYWELEVTAQLPGIDYQAVFLLPVYSPQ